MTFIFSLPTYAAAQTGEELLTRIDEGLSEALAGFFESFDTEAQKIEAANILMNAVCWHGNLHSPEESSETKQ